MTSLDSKLIAVVDYDRWIPKLSKGIVIIIMLICIQGPLIIIADKGDQPQKKCLDYIRYHSPHMHTSDICDDGM